MNIELLHSEVFAIDLNGNSPSAIEKSARKTFQDILLHDGFILVDDADTRTADIIVSKNNTTYYFEIKSTTKNIQEEQYFGSASFTEWRTAFDNPDTYSFVIAYFKNNSFTFYKINPEELIKYSTIPPVVVFFSLKPASKKLRIQKESSRKALRLTKNTFIALDKAFQEQKKRQINESNNEVE